MGGAGVEQAPPPAPPSKSATAVDSCYEAYRSVYRLIGLLISGIGLEAAAAAAAAELSAI